MSCHTVPECTAPSACICCANGWEEVVPLPSADFVLCVHCRMDVIAGESPSICLSRGAAGHNHWQCLPSALHQCCDTAGRKTQGIITGNILVNGHPKEQRTWSRVVGCEGLHKLLMQHCSAEALMHFLCCHTMLYSKAHTAHVCLQMWSRMTSIPLR